MRLAVSIEASGDIGAVLVEALREGGAFEGVGLSRLLRVAMHPGTVDTRLSRPFARAGIEPLVPETAAHDLRVGLARLGPGDGGGFFDQPGKPIPL